MICEYKIGKDVEVDGHVVTWSTVLALALKNRTNRTYDSPSPDYDLISGPPEYEAEVILSRMQIR